VKTDTAKWNKPRTIIENMPDGKKISKVLKRKLCCGGTYKDNIIILQGNHVSELSEYLENNGYKFVIY
jgi:translation initiation factor 1 (eIF-1/SUI1)